MLLVRLKIFIQKKASKRENNGGEKSLQGGDYEGLADDGHVDDQKTVSRPDKKTTDVILTKSYGSGQHKINMMSAVIIG